MTDEMKLHLLKVRLEAADDEILKALDNRCAIMSEIYSYWKNLPESERIDTELAFENDEITRLSQLEIHDDLAQCVWDAINRYSDRKLRY